MPIRYELTVRLLKVQISKEDKQVILHSNTIDIALVSVGQLIISLTIAMASAAAVRAPGVIQRLEQGFLKPYLGVQGGVLLRGKDV